jgi:transcription elongation factor GreA
MAAVKGNGQHRHRNAQEREEFDVNESLAEDRVDKALLVTPDGYEQLRAELEALTTKGRADMSERLRVARDDGPLADNPALYELLDEQAQLEGRIATLQARLAAAEIVVPANNGAASIGSFVRVRDRRTGDVVEYELVGSIESDIGNGRLSVDAPVGRALVEKGVGAIVDVETPSGPLALTVLSVREPPQARKAA